MAASSHVLIEMHVTRMGGYYLASEKKQEESQVSKVRAREQTTINYYYLYQY